MTSQVIAIAEAVRSRRCQAVDVVDAALRRVEQRNAALNAFVCVEAELAREDARAVDAKIAAGYDPGPLAGVPFGVKDVHRCRGFRATYGSVLSKDAPRADTDEACIARLRAAGAIPVGVTAMPEWGLDSSTHSTLWGVTRNPWNPALTPGGSSGGSSAAVAAAMVPFATAGDSAGSIRGPAAFTGLVGLLASHGRIPNVDGFDEFTVNGALTTSVTDAARLLDVMQGPDPCDRTTLPRYEGSFERDSETLEVAGLRATWSGDFGHAIVDAEVAQIAHAAALQLIAAAGLRQVDATCAFPPVNREWMKATMHRVRVGLTIMGVLPDRADVLSSNVQELLGRYAGVTEQDAYRARKALPAIEQAAAAFFGESDVLLCPTTSRAAFPAESTLSRITVGEAHLLASAEPFGFLANACWLPSISVPAGLTRDGLPVGLMITGRRFRDDVVLRLARIWEQVNGWPQFAPGYDMDPVP